MSRGLISVLAVLSIAGVLVWAASSAPLLSTGSAHGRPGKGYGYGAKVVICHRTHSKKNPFVTIVVSQSAVAAHLAHGDTLGACPRTKHKSHHAKHKSHHAKHKSHHAKHKSRHHSKAHVHVKVVVKGTHK
jgi:hypothetical protein